LLGQALASEGSPVNWVSEWTILSIELGQFSDDIFDFFELLGRFLSSVFSLD
jgi:hypothetical protein